MLISIGIALILAGLVILRVPSRTAASPEQP
jgi:hypothetical protein